MSAAMRTSGEKESTWGVPERGKEERLEINMAYVIVYTIDWEIFAHKNNRLLNFAFYFHCFGT